MSYMIAAECVNCGACLMDCPVSAIWAGSDRYVIDSEKCVECSGYFAVPRCVAACPVAACTKERMSYLQRSKTLALRGSPPVVLSCAGNVPSN